MTVEQLVEKLKNLLEEAESRIEPPKPAQRPAKAAAPTTRPAAAPRPTNASGGLYGALQQADRTITGRCFSWKVGLSPSGKPNLSVGIETIDDNAPISTWFSAWGQEACEWGEGKDARGSVVTLGLKKSKSGYENIVYVEIAAPSTAPVDHEIPF
jgi:hypothetical protein